VDAVLARLERLRDELVGAGRAPSPHTLASYLRRWRQWAMFADSHEVDELPAEPAHVAAFVLARHEAGVGLGTIEANLSAIRWVHEQRVGDPAVTELARVVLGVLRRRDGAVSVAPAPVLSLGALLAMVRWQPPGTLGFSAKVVRLYTGARPRQLVAATGRDVEFGPGDEWVVLECPPVPAVGKHPALGPARFRFVRGRSPLECPVRALRAVAGVAGEGALFSSSQLFSAAVRGFDPMTSGGGVPVRLALRDRALVCVGYGGALRVEEIAQARVENLEVAPAGYRLVLDDAKSAGPGERQVALLERRDDDLDPVVAVDDWLAVRGDADGPLFPALHHQDRGRSDMYEGLTAQSVGLVIGGRASAVGLDGVSGYSLRRSWATHQHLADPTALAWVSLRLRHAHLEVTTRYIEDLHLDLLDPAEMLSSEVIAAAPAARPSARKALGFVGRPLGELVAEADRLGGQRRALAPATTAAYANGWRAWCRFAAEHAIVALPAEPDHVAAFVAGRLTTGGSPHTMAGYLSGIRHAHEHHGVAPAGGFTLAAEVLAGHRRVNPWAPNRAPVLTVDELRAMAAAALADGDDIALGALCVGYAGALRLDDLFAARLEHIEAHPAGAVLRFARSKTNSSGRRADGVLLVARPDELNPITALARLQDARPATGALLSWPGSPHRPVAKDTIVDRLRRAARSAGLDVVPHGNSLRRSWATHAYESGLDLFTISRHLRHADPDVTKSYVQALSAWVNNPAEHLARHHNLLNENPSQ
jgi:integrase